MTGGFFNSAVIVGAIFCGSNQPSLAATRPSGWDQQRDVWSAAERAPGAVIQSVKEHCRGEAKTAPELVCPFDALFQGLRLRTVEAGYLVANCLPYPICIWGRCINGGCFEDIDNHRVDVFFKAARQPSQVSGISQGLTAA